MKMLTRLHWMAAGRLGRCALVLVGSAVLGCALAGIASGDILELRDGQIVQGQFIGGSPLNIRFRVSGQEQVFATKDVLNIGFTDTTDASDAPAATQSTAPPPPATDAASPAAVPGPPPPRPARRRQRQPLLYPQPQRRTQIRRPRRHNPVPRRPRRLPFPQGPPCLYG